MGRSLQNPKNNVLEQLSQAWLCTLTVGVLPGKDCTKYLLQHIVFRVLSLQTRFPVRGGNSLRSDLPIVISPCYYSTIGCPKLLGVRLCETMGSSVVDRLIEKGDQRQGWMMKSVELPEITGQGKNQKVLCFAGVRGFSGPLPLPLPLPLSSFSPLPISNIRSSPQWDPAAFSLALAGAQLPFPSTFPLPASSLRGAPCVSADGRSILPTWRRSSLSSLPPRYICQI